MLLQGLPEIPAPPLAASEPLDQPLVRPSEPLVRPSAPLEFVQPIVQPPTPTTTLVTATGPQLILPKTCPKQSDVNTAEGKYTCEDHSVY